VTSRNLLEYSLTSALAGAFFGMVVVAATGCAHSRVPDPIVYPVHVPTGACEAAGARLEELRCVGVRSGTEVVYTSQDVAPEGVPLWLTPDGDPFAEACHYAASQGRPWKSECLAVIETCEDIEAAFSGEDCQ